jgi:hypothetical protein
MSATPTSLQAFVTFCQRLKGDEKGESQAFLDRFFRAFGHEGAIEAGAEFEDHLKKASAIAVPAGMKYTRSIPHKRYRCNAVPHSSENRYKGKMGFADLVWRPLAGNSKRSRQGVRGVLIEMKKRGEDLSKHYA